MSDHNLEVATLGGGCFWCLDAIYRDVRGVDRVVSGYSGGHVANPTYEQVCGKRTGHAEVVQVWFDPAVISYDDILYIFWRIHDSRYWQERPGLADPVLAAGGTHPAPQTDDGGVAR